MQKLITIDNKLENQYALSIEEVEILEAYLIENNVIPLGYLTENILGIKNRCLVFLDTEKFHILINKYLDEHPLFKENLLDINLDLNDLFNLNSENKFKSNSNKHDELLLNQIRKLTSQLEPIDIPNLYRWLDQLGFETNLENIKENNESFLDLTFNFNSEVLPIIQEFINSDSVTRRLSLVKLQEFIPINLINQYNYKPDYLKISEDIDFYPLNPEEKDPKEFLYKNSSELNNILSNYFENIKSKIYHQGRSNLFKLFDLESFREHNDIDPWIS